MHCPASVKVIDATGNTLRNNLVTKLKLNTSSTHYAAYSFVDILNMLSENSSPTNPNTMLVFYPTWNSNPGSGKDSVGVVCKAAYFDNNQKKLIFANPDYQATWCPDMCPH